MSIHGWLSTARVHWTARRAWTASTQVGGLAAEQEGDTTEKRDGTGAGPQETLAAFCDDLLQLWKDAGLTRRELEKLSGYSRSALSKATSGPSLPSLDLTEAYVGACEAPDPEAWRARRHRLTARLRTNPN